MKSKIEEVEDKQEQTNNIILISGIGGFFSFLAFCICLVNFSDKKSDHKQDDSDKSSLVLAIAFKIVSVICGFIYLRETQNNTNNQTSFWDLLKDFAKSTEEALKAFIGSEVNLTENYLATDISGENLDLE